MFAKPMMELGNKRSVIREIFEYGNKRKSQIGADNVFDFSLGNPSVAPPSVVNDTIRDLLQNERAETVHAYTSAAGDLAVRQRIADYIRDTFDVDATANDLYMTCGAAASLCITFNAILEAGDEAIALAPYFPEYKVFVEKAGGTFCSVPCRESDFQIDFDALEAAINEKTALIIVNSPNNPSGAVLSEETIVLLADLLQRAQKRIGHPIYIVADEPYRELVYGDVTVPYIPRYYNNTIVCYSFSKSLSLPGERIGYIFVPAFADRAVDIMSGVGGAGRALGYVCAPVLFQRVAAACLGHTADIAIYQDNRDKLCSALAECGFDVVRPDGAFYLFIKAPTGDANEFAERAKKYELLVVPSDDFGVTGYVRVSYCVSPEMIERALPAFRKLAEEYR